MENILSFERKNAIDYYELLGCDESSTVEQICAEYRARVLEVHPDKNLKDPDATEKFKRLQVAKDILTDETKRRHYDRWKHSGLAISYEEWSGMGKHTHTSMHWTSPRGTGFMLEGSEDDGTRPARSSNDHINILPKQNDVKPGDIRVERNVEWKSEPASDVLRKFRNYEI